LVKASANQRTGLAVCGNLRSHKGTRGKFPQALHHLFLPTRKKHNGRCFARCLLRQSASVQSIGLEPLQLRRESVCGTSCHTRIAAKG